MVGLRTCDVSAGQRENSSAGAKLHDDSIALDYNVLQWAGQSVKVVPSSFSRISGGQLH